jgi:hypothetical protein
MSKSTPRRFLQPRSHDADRDRIPETFHFKVHINSLDLTLIIVPIKEALELQKYFVQTVAKFSVARMVCFSSDVALKILDIIK